MKKLFFFLFIIGLTLNVNGQFRRIALLEEATNASCGPCAANNPHLQQFFEHNFGGVISVRYHSWWPGTDPMYSDNTADNRARINYYGINGVPTYTMDGVVKGMPSNPVQMGDAMWNDISSTSPFWIKVSANPEGTSYNVNVTVIVGDNVTATNLYLRTAVIERRIHFSSPPGTNGEKDFNDVMRKLLPNATGQALTNLTPGDTLNFSFSADIQHSWNVSDLAAVAWIQSDDTKEILQSNINIPTYVIQSNRSRAEIISGASVINTDYVLYNNNSDTIAVHLTPEVTLSDGWSFDLYYEGNPTDEINALVLPGDTLSFGSQITTDTSGSAAVGLYAQNLRDAYQYGFTSTYFGFIPKGKVLLIDADGANYESYYETALDSAKVEYTFLDRAYLSALGNDLLTRGFEAVYWNAGWGFPAFVQADLDFLTQFLDNGGRLFIGGQDIGWDVFDSDGSSNFQAAKDFYHNYLGATYIQDNSGIHVLTGVDGDPITDGLAFNLRAVYSYYPEVIRPNGTGASTILKYSNSTQIGAVKNEGENFKTVYMGFGLEQVGTETARLQLVKNSLIWFGVLQPNSVSDETSTPNTFALEQNYPNPFNPTTTINYSIPSVRHWRIATMRQSHELTVHLTVFDILGREVATLVNSKQAPGTYSVRFDASKLGSGVYFYTLRAGDFTITKKMTLIK